MFDQRGASVAAQIDTRSRRASRSAAFSCLSRASMVLKSGSDAGAVCAWLSAVAETRSRTGNRCFIFMRQSLLRSRRTGFLRRHRTVGSRKVTCSCSPSRMRTANSEAGRGQRFLYRGWRSRVVKVATFDFTAFVGRALRNMIASCSASRNPSI